MDSSTPGLPPARILIAEDEAPLRNLVRMSLEANGHVVTVVGNGEEALASFIATPYDLVILDIMMPKMDGLEVCREIRRRSETPVIMITALGSTEDLVKGLETGADDYIAKPFTFREVQARINAILRRMKWTAESKPQTAIEIGRVTVDTDAMDVRVGGELIHLTPIEFKLLYTLMSNAGKALSRIELFQEVWGYDFVGATNLVEVTIRRLREKVEVDPSNPTHILTVRGTGYKFRTL
ncbi:MAG: response regulator transcription factor [Anaerolineae bacterium]|nr:response regulator transcription factor [Anaerolineae bacterium]MCB9132971.1 response regulator transcription factor [Anaerolineales bacterium]MCB0238836.1 response regulator transcription factor [Anaerolineae bacterium]MCB0244069.1 response regulator transcription factor [Anaerolineae bacterium]MCB0248089.1 response regulator transcription factor [Anaerolineae bacterium]